MADSTTTGAANPVDGSSSEGDVFVFPTSLAQQRFWQIGRQQPGNPVYNVAVRFRIDGKLDVPLLQRAFNEVLRRHEVLRASFRREGGSLVQVIAPASIALGYFDLRRLPELGHEAEVNRLSTEEATKPFDVAQAPLFRASLLQIADEQHILLVTVHHLVSDGWSIGLISSEVGAIYESLALNRRPVLPELPIQYTDYAVWQQEWLQNADFQQQLAYWTKQLSGITTVPVPTDRPRRPELTFGGNIISMVLPRSLTDAIQQFSTRSGGTFFVTVLATFKLLLHLYSRHADISVGTQVAGRDRVELENLIGLFINTVVLRTDLSGNPTFGQLVERTRETALQSVASQDVPFEKVLEALNPEPDPSRNPLFQVNFICQRDFVKPVNFAGLTLTAVPSKSQGALYDLNFFFVERPDGWRMSCEYNTDLFEQSTAQKMLDDYRALLEEVIANPTRPIADFVLRSALIQKAETAPGGLKVNEPQAKNAPSANQDVYHLPASLAQRRFWLLNGLAPTNPAFNMPVAVRIRGVLNLDALERSFQSLIQRHEALRTTFAVKDEQLVQVIAPQGRFTLETRSLEDLPEDQREGKARELFTRSAERPFDLAEGPLLRAQALRLSGNEHLLLFTLHHIICDGWSNGILARELWKFYEGNYSGTAVQLPELTIQYGDFAHWEGEFLKSRAALESLGYWKKQLNGRLPVLNVPTDRPVVPGQVARGGIESVLLSSELSGACKDLCKREHITLFILFLTAFKTLLYQYSAQDDVIVGSPVANRTPETEGAVGPFSNPLCLRTNLSGNPTFKELLKRVAEVSFGALDQKDLPFERILDEVTAPGQNGRNVLFQFYFFYQVAFLQPVELAGLSVTPLPTLSPGAAFELQLGIIERPEGIRAQLQYNADLFDPETVKRLLAQYQRLLESVVAAPDQRIAQVPALTDSERATVASWRKDHPVQPCASEKPAYVAPRNADEQQLAKLWEATLRVRPISVTANFFDLGGHSLQVARLLRLVEKSFGIKLTLAMVFEAPTIESMALLIRK